ncbi:uncharacterized protein TM35_000012770 [Trypanosoma theileri]|uniref:Uncharacterized protein n=1 Tax=Trypanosoma theileri TaxID=67003 RepID=A0A1X0PAC0_9TRYP|nr:uncharacterized protein TM35_000012770 [Trypanosoma theileri]ORC93400.1 hypothetical protein TM35_000012770 [Trypanosoma theileri]
MRHSKQHHQQQQPEFRESTLYSGGSSCTTKEEIVRARLLAELSSLRERHDALRKRAMGVEKQQQQQQQQHEEDEHEREQQISGTKMLGMDDSGRGSPFLGQTDRDAIEAFFNDSEDDFTREFNEGRGKYQRSDLLDGLILPQKRK